MAASATPRIAEPGPGPAPGRPCIAVAYSGGRDSTALLHACARAALALHEQGVLLQVAALHVHHGLSARADDWLSHGQAQCARWATEGLPVSFHWRRLAGAPAPGQSVEAWAREGRYTALREMAAEVGAEGLMLAHHRRDQAETFLLQALRGAGAAGLAGMPRLQWRAGLCWMRPWLGQGRERVEAYLAAHGLEHVDDDSNADARFARNQLRLQLWPQLCESFPGAEQNLAQAAHWAQQDLALQRELAEEDSVRWVDASQALDVDALRVLSAARAGNLLRHWLAGRLARPAPATLVQRLLTEAVPAPNGAHWPIAAGRLQKHQERLIAWVDEGPQAAAMAGREALAVDLGTPGLHACPDWAGSWLVSASEQRQGARAPASLLSKLFLRPREGGEQFQRLPGTPPRSLKKAWQTAGVAALRRDGPILHGETGGIAHAVWVPGLGLDARAWAPEGEPGLTLEWLPQTP